MNRLSALDDVPKFDLCKCLPHDIMHVLLEGVVPHHLKLLLQYCVNTSKYFTVQYLNPQITTFSYGYSESMNAPRPIDRDGLNSRDQKIVPSGIVYDYTCDNDGTGLMLFFFFPASQMWLLARLLPLMVGMQVPDGDPHWLCFMELLMIAVMSTAVEVTEDTAYSLIVIIESYLFHFNQLHPDSMTPKTHYLLHLPEQMRQ